MPARTSMVDWDLAVSRGLPARRPGPGDHPARGRRRGRRAARRTPTGRPALVREFTGLVRRRSAPRRCWSSTGPAGSRPTPTASPRARARSIDKLPARKRAPPAPVAEAVGSRVTGARGRRPARLHVLARCSASSTRSTARLPATPAAGRLLLVAPNIVHVERELGVDPHDFRLWVCLHEETHRVQFTAVPWMRDHLRGEIETLVGGVDLDPAKVAAMVGDGVQRLGDLVRGDDDGSLLDLVATPEQREVLDRITGVMSLLEGHADVVMDGVGPEVIPSVDEIRAQVQPAPQGRRHARPGAAPAARARREDGAVPRRRRASSARVVDQVGMDGLQRGLGRARRTCPPRPRSPTRRPGYAACTAEPAAWRSTPPSPRSGSPYAVRSPDLAPDAAGAGRLLRRGRLARAAGRHRLRGAASRPWRVVGVTVDHGLQDGSAEHAARVVGADGAPSASTRPSRCGSRSSAAGQGPEAAAREARYAVLDEVARALRRRTSCCSGTPATTRPRPCCSGWPAARAAGRWPGCAAAFEASTAARCST